jgi:hypothetical protein
MLMVHESPSFNAGIDSSTGPLPSLICIRASSYAVMFPVHGFRMDDSMKDNRFRVSQHRLSPNYQDKHCEYCLTSLVNEHSLRLPLACVVGHNTEWWLCVVFLT